MKKVIILIPVYNDWESLNKLLEEINSNIKNISNVKFDCLVVNDASTIEQPKIIRPGIMYGTRLLVKRLMNLKWEKS